MCAGLRARIALARLLLLIAAMTREIIRVFFCACVAMGFATAQAGEMDREFSGQVFSGVDTGIGFAGASKGGAINAGADASMFNFKPWNTKALPVLARAYGSLQLFGTSTVSLDARLGYLFTRLEYSRGQENSNLVDYSQTLDASLILRARSRGGHKATLEFGGEHVFRDEELVIDSIMRPGNGLRIAVSGEVALSSMFGLFLLGELRTGPHLDEVSVLPTARVGISVKL